MSLGLLLLPAVGGYWFLTNWNYTRYQLERDSGYRLLFRSAIVGILLYCFSRAVTFAVDLICHRSLCCGMLTFRNPIPAK